jgi:Lon protease-like protein
MQEVVMRRDLPTRPSLDQLKRQAKDLVDAFRRHDAEALARVRDALPAAHGKDDAALGAMPFALHDAQSTIAREHGFSSWNELREHVASRLGPKAIEALMQAHPNAPLPGEVVDALVAAAEDTDGPVPLDAPLPIVPVPNAMLARGAVAPLHIGRASTIAAIEAARAGTNAVALFTQKDAAQEAPSDDALHAVGCAARLSRVVPAGEHGLWIVVKAVDWVRLEGIEQRTPFLTGRCAAFAIAIEHSDEARRLERVVRERVRALVAAMPEGEKLLRRTERMSALELADATIANLPCSVDEKASYAAEPSLVGRLRWLVAFFDRAA